MLNLVIGRINQAFPRISDVILHCLARFAETDPYVITSHQSHLDLWNGTIRPFLSDTEQKKAAMAVRGLSGALKIRTLLSHGIHRLETDADGRVMVFSRIPHEMTTAKFHKLYPAAPLPRLRRYSKNQRIIPISYFAPGFSEKDRYHHASHPLPDLMRLADETLPDLACEVERLSNAAVTNYHGRPAPSRP